MVETQKLIDAAISLHDKELARRQFKFALLPLLIALIAVAGTILTPFINSMLLNHSNSNIKQTDSIYNWQLKAFRNKKICAVAEKIRKLIDISLIRLNNNISLSGLTINIFYLFIFPLSCKISLF